MFYRKYNYQVSFYLEFPLETVYKFCNTNNIPTINNNNRINIPLFACFQQYSQSTYLKGDNKIYCNICQSQCDALYLTSIYSLPPIIIIVLNRGKVKFR